MDRFRIVEGIGAYFVTFSVINWLQVFVKEEPVNLLLDNLVYCIEHKNLRINAYVVMPDHFHAILLDADFDNMNLQTTLNNFRKFTGRKLADYVDSHFPSSITSTLRDIKVTDRERRFWQHGWHSEGIFFQTFYKQKFDYIHMNPCRKGLVQNPENWQYSSAGFWINGEPGRIPLSVIEW
jgi:putative transposase